MLKVARARTTRGVSLIELMIGIAVGLVVLVGLASVYVNSVRGGRTTTTTNQLNQEMRALMDIMVNDIRRAGYWGAAAKGATNPFTAALTRPVITGVNSDCILYSYDAKFKGGTNGTVDAGTDFFGFRLTALGVVQVVESAVLASTGTACDAVDWENLTDELAVQVSQLTFTTVGSKCIAFDPTVYVATNAATYTQWTTLAGSGPACDAGASGAPAPYPAATNSFVETLQVNIVLQGRSLTDAALPPVTMNETVLIRNNRVITP